MPEGDRRWADILGSAGPLLLAVAAFWVVLFVTQWGIGLGSDSAVYIAAARNLLGGYGLSWVSAGMEVHPMTLHAPLLSLLFAGLEVIGINSLSAARVLNALSFGMEVLLVGVLIRRVTGSWAFSLLGGWLVLSSGEMISIHSWAMSDPVYLALGMVGLVLFTSFLVERQRSLLFSSSIAAGLAYLARYVGLSLVVALTISLVLSGRRRWKLTVGQASVLLTCGLIPSLIWLVRNLVLTGQASGRSPTFDVPAMLSAVRNAASIVMNWLLPLRLVEWLFESPARWVISIVATLMMSALVGWLLHSKQGEHSFLFAARTKSLVPVVLYFGAFLGLIFATSLLSRPASDIDERILSPAYGLLVIVVVFFLHEAWRLRGWLIKVVIVALCILLVRNKSVYAYWVVRNLQGDGRGYSSAAWRDSKTIRALQELSPSLVYTDDIAAVYLLAGRRSYLAPLRTDAATGEPRTTYEADLATMRLRIREERALLVLFQPNALPPGVGPVEDLTEGLTSIRVAEDGMIFASSP